MQKKRREVKKPKRQKDDFKLTPQQRKRNRVIALLVLFFLILFLFSKCSSSNEERNKERNDTKNTDANHTTLLSEALDIDKNSSQEREKVDDKKDEPILAKYLSTDKKIAKEQLLEKYRKRKTYATAISVAEYFYSNRDYQSAIKWAVVANGINKQEGKPWNIYIKSKIALKEYKKAKEAIESYLVDHPSKELELLKEVLDKKIKKDNNGSKVR